MTEADTSDDTSEPTEESSADRAQNVHVIFVPGAGEDNKQRYESDVVEAASIIERAGYDDPDQYILEALRGQSDNVEEQFDPQGEAGPAEVDLTDQHRKHFRVTTRGQVFI